MKKFFRKLKKSFGILLLIVIISFVSQYFPELKSIFFNNQNKTYTGTSSKHLHKEAYYQQLWCNKHSGIMEYKNSDKTRVDCLTNDYAVEFDFAEKWAESIGQSLHYELMTGKKAMIVLILEHPETQMVYYNRTKKLGQKYGINVEYMTSDSEDSISSET